MHPLLSPRRRVLLKALGAATLATAGCGGAGARARELEFSGPAMGTAFTAKITVTGKPISAAGQGAAREAVERALATVESRMSTFRPDSELVRFNRHPPGTPFALSPDTFAVFGLAQQVSAATGGAFDVTVGPAADAWGFGPSTGYRVPSADALAALRPRVGYGMLALDPRDGSIVKARGDLGADFSGIAKGYAVDQAARALESLGFGDYLVEAGGEVRTRGVNGGGEPWRIGIERPDAWPPQVHRVVPLSGPAMATSGDYRIFFEADGRRYAHEIDPATGAPAQNALASATVVAADCAFADAMATALMVLGPERGLALAEAQGLAAYFIVRTPGGGFADRATRAFAALGVG